MTRLSRRTLLQTAAALPFASVAFPGFAQGTRPEFTVAVAALPATLEPARELSNVGTRVTYSIFDTLIRRDFLGSPDGGLQTAQCRPPNWHTDVAMPQPVPSCRLCCPFRCGL